MVWWPARCKAGRLFLCRVNHENSARVALLTVCLEARVLDGCARPWHTAVACRLLGPDRGGGCLPCSALQVSGAQGEGRAHPPPPLVLPACRLSPDLRVQHPLAAATAAAGAAFAAAGVATVAATTPWTGCAWLTFTLLAHDCTCVQCLMLATPGCLGTEEKYRGLWGRRVVYIIGCCVRALGRWGAWLHACRVLRRLSNLAFIVGIWAPGSPLKRIRNQRGFQHF